MLGNTATPSPASAPRSGPTLPWRSTLARSLALVLAGALVGHPMDLIFTPVEIVAVALSVLITRQLISDGQSNWLEGMMLVAVYLMLGVGFFYLPARPA